jgi:hypothetical protein
MDENEREDASRRKTRRGGKVKKKNGGSGAGMGDSPAPDARCANADSLLTA